jgi:acetolactate synthase regulatory subunit
MLLLPPGVPTSSVQRLSLDVIDAPGVLLRVIGICQRRGARVVAMTFGAGADGAARIELAVTGDEGALHRVRSRLEGAIEVQLVQSVPKMRSPASPSPGRM